MKVANIDNAKFVNSVALACGSATYVTLLS